MSILQDFDFSQFMSKNEVLIENHNIENCRISGIKSDFLRIIKCNFKNVVFDNSFYEVYARMENCEFMNCSFRDTFEGDDLELAIHDSVFSNCLFENIGYKSSMVQSDIVNCKFMNCNFTDIQIEGDICLIGAELIGGKIEHFRFAGNQIMKNTFSNMEMKDVDLNVALIDNKIESIIFKNVKVMGYNKDNTFINCNTNDITFL